MGSDQAPGAESFHMVENPDMESFSFEQLSKAKAFRISPKDTKLFRAAV
jgi:hypothetical protein